MTGAPTKTDIRRAVDQVISNTLKRDLGQVMSNTLERNLVSNASSVFGVVEDLGDITLDLAQLQETISSVEAKIKRAFQLPFHMMMEPRHIFHPELMTPLGGFYREIRTSKHATEPDGYNWKPSRYRSARIAKKLRQRLGPMERRKPCMYMLSPAGVPPLLIVHPSLHDNLKARIAKEGQDDDD